MLVWLTSTFAIVILITVLELLSWIERNQEFNNEFYKKIFSTFCFVFLIVILSITFLAGVEALFDAIAS